MDSITEAIQGLYAKNQDAIITGHNELCHLTLEPLIPAGIKYAERIVGDLFLAYTQQPLLIRLMAQAEFSTMPPPDEESGSGI